MKRMISEDGLSSFLNSFVFKRLSIDDEAIFSTKNKTLNVSLGTNSIEYKALYSQIVIKSDTTSAPSLDVIAKGRNHSTQFSFSGASGRSCEIRLLAYRGGAGNIHVVPCLPDPTEDGTYTLKLVKSGSSITYNWVKDV